MEEMLTIAMPHCGLAANSTSGGEVVERELLSRVAEQGVDPHILRPAWRGLRWWNSPLYFRSVIGACVRLHTPRLIRAHSLRYAGPATIAAKRQYGLPLVAHFHHLERDHLSWLDRWVLRHADLVTTDSEFSWRQAQVFRINALVIPLGTSLQPITPIPLNRLVLFMGGNKPRKNLPFLLNLWPDVVRRVPDARLVIAGPGHWLPRTDQEIRTLYQRVRVLAFPSYLEGFGLPVLDAMAAGRPVVCSNVTALPELGARRTLPLDPLQWVDALVHYLTDDGACIRDGYENWIRASAYTWERTAALMVAAWRKLA